MLASVFWWWVVLQVILGYDVFQHWWKMQNPKKDFWYIKCEKYEEKHTHLLSNFWNCSKNMFLSIRNRILFLVTFILLKRKTSSAHFRPIDLSSCYLDIYLYLNSFFLCQGKNLGNYNFFKWFLFIPETGDDLWRAHINKWCFSGFFESLAEIQIFKSSLYIHRPWNFWKIQEFVNAGKNSGTKKNILKFSRSNEQIRVWYNFWSKNTKNVSKESKIHKN